jgi:hypothetical protein
MVAGPWDSALCRTFRAAPMLLRPPRAPQLTVNVVAFAVDAKSKVISTRNKVVDLLTAFIECLPVCS